MPDNPRQSESESFLDSIIENIPNMIFVKDAKELRFVRFNRAGEELLGFKKSDLIGKNDYDFFPKDQAEFFISRDRSVLDHKVLVDIPEEPIDTKFKGKRFLHTKKIPILDADGEPLYLLGISEDITDRKRMEETLREVDSLKALDKIKSEFISVAAHQLRTPLSGVRWSSSLLLSGEIGELNEQQRALVQKSYETTDRMIGLVNDLLGADRVASDKFSYEFALVDLGELAAEAVAEIRPLAGVRGVGIEVEVAKALPQVKADAEKLRAALQNLLENAVKYSKKGSEVTVAVGRSASEPSLLELVVRDQGIGIPKEEQESIFQRFYRAKNAVKAEANGSGLGLYIVKSIVERHGGSIRFESAEGKGTTFFITVPVAA